MKLLGVGLKHVLWRQTLPSASVAETLIYSYLKYLLKHTQKRELWS